MHNHKVRPGASCCPSFQHNRCVGFPRLKTLFHVQRSKSSQSENQWQSISPYQRANSTELLQKLIVREVEFLIVGGYAAMNWS